MSPIEVTVIMFASMLILMLIGLPVTFCLGTVGVLATFFLWGPHAFNVVYFSLEGVSGSIVLTAVPLFMFMGFMLHYSGVARDIFTTIYKWAGGIPGALGAGTVVVCAIIAAMIGLSGPTVLSLGVVVLPALLERGYNKRLTVGTVMSGGALGFLIPPSLMMVMFGFLGDVSVGKLFAAGVMPGLLLASIYIVFIMVRCMIRPEDGPALPVDQRASWKERFISLRYIVCPGILICTLLYAIFSGVASPTEASAIGAGLSVMVAVAHRRFSWKVLHQTCVHTMRIAGFAGYITICALIFSKTYSALGATSMIRSLVVGLDVNPWLILVVMQLSFFLLGMFLDDIAILFLCMPIYLPIIKSFGFDPVWFGILYVMNMQMAYLTPPYGLNLFFMKAVAPPEVTIKDIYFAVIPFLFLQALALAMVMIFPQIAMWLPSQLF